MDALTPQKIRLLGTEFDNLTRPEVLDFLLSRSQKNHFIYVVTPNADHLERLLRLPRLRPAYHHAALCLLDSQLIANFARRLGLARPEVITGADLTIKLLARLDHERVAVIGLCAATFNRLASLYPRIIFLHHEPPMGLLNNPGAFQAAKNFACESQAAFTFIALGSPLQELLAHAIACEHGAAGIGLCIGAALEFAAGVKKRAPHWMRRHGLEWAHRLLHDPRHLAGRYLRDDPRVLLALIIAAYRQKAR
jgi:exopolysaccharide biosynthesis WecB/TagA/CpsF family protein